MNSDRCFRVKRGTPKPFMRVWANRCSAMSANSVRRTQRYMPNVRRSNPRTVFQALDATSATLRDFLQTSIDAYPSFGAAANPWTNRAMRIRLQTLEEVTRNNGQGGLSLWLYRVVRDEERLKLHRCRCGCTTSPRRSRTVRTKAIPTPSNTSSARCSSRSIPGPCSREASSSARCRQISSFRRFDPLRGRTGSRMRIDPMPASHAAAERADEHLS